MAVHNSYTITLKVLDFLNNGGTHEALRKAMKVKRIEHVHRRIEKQDWSKNDVKNLFESGLIVLQKRRLPRTKLKNAEEISSQVKRWMEELGSIEKFCRTLGIKNPTTYKQRLVLHNWTAQELSILISKRIVDDNF